MFTVCFILYVMLIVKALGIHSLSSLSDFTSLLHKIDTIRNSSDWNVEKHIFQQIEKNLSPQISGEKAKATLRILDLQTLQDIYAQAMLGVEFFVYNSAINSVIKVKSVLVIEIVNYVKNQ